MGRVNRLMERRVLRRAADQALLTSLTQRPQTADQPGGPPDRDFEYKSADPVDTREAYDHEPTTDPIPVVDVDDLAPAQSDDYARNHHDESQPEAVDVYDVMPGEPDDVESAEIPPAPIEPLPLRARPLPEAAVVRPHLDFAMPAQPPWYRTKPQAAAALAAVVVVAVLCGGWLVLRSPSTTAEQSTVDAPTSVPPAPTTAPPTAVSAPIPPPAPPPPPPPPPPPQADAPVYSGPQRQYSEPRRSSPPSQEQKPRTDVTRAPISVAPVPRPVQGSNSGAPGDGRVHGCFGWC